MAFSQRVNAYQVSMQMKVFLKSLSKMHKYEVVEILEDLMSYLVELIY